ncbi:MAG TPA: iron-sulfur cluster assembly accessory protein [Actinomycetota bacterium]|nr:iron-sulfur cluster assembly accessory protein [Actinomycetota bacterium]
METRSTIVSLTPRAAEKVREFISVEPNPDAMVLRMEVQPGGCAGFRYGLFFDDQVADSDIIEESEGVRVATDPMSAPYLRGVVVDWAESLQQSGFVINNPNAGGRCACGDSFQ